MIKFNETEKPLVIIIGQSSFIMPYTVQSIKPISNDKNITIDKSSTFFSLMIFITCGKRETEEKMPATMPMMNEVFKL